MEWIQAITIIATILVPMLAGFGWIVHQMNNINYRICNIETRLAVVETLLAVMRGVPITHSTPEKNS